MFGIVVVLYLGGSSCSTSIHSLLFDTFDSVLEFVSTYFTKTGFLPTFIETLQREHVRKQKANSHHLKYS